MYLISFSYFCSLPYHADSNISTTLSWRYLPISGCQGQMWMSANGDAHFYVHSTVCRWRELELEKRLQRENAFSCVLVYHGGGAWLDLAGLKLKASLAVREQATWLGAVPPLSEFYSAGRLLPEQGHSLHDRGIAHLFFLWARAMLALFFLPPES